MKSIKCTVTSKCTECIFHLTMAQTQGFTPTLRLEKVLAGSPERSGNHMRYSLPTTRQDFDDVESE